MNDKATDTFTVPELYLLAAAFDGHVLFGLPEKEIYQLKGEEVFAEAHQQLVEKEIITSEGKLTDGGAIIVQAVEFYHQSNKYVRINNLMFAFRQEEEDELILLVEIEEQEKYKLLVLSKAIVLKVLGENFPVVFREPVEEEKTFLKVELSHEERNEIDQHELDHLMNIEFFHLKEKHQDGFNPSYYQQWFIFEKENKLMMIDTVQKRYYHASQYWFLKLLFDEMEFPYKEAK
jgi:hypothetical protein